MANGQMLTWLSKPSVNNIKKKQIDQNGAPGIIANASGYTTKARPGPKTKTYILKTALKHTIPQSLATYINKHTRVSSILT